MADTELRNELAQWIDRDAIADAILDELKNQGADVTLDNAKAVWLDFLDNVLPDGVKRAIEYTLTT